MNESWFAKIRNFLAGAHTPAGPVRTAGYDYDLLLELLQLIGNTYVEYFATRYGLRPDKWKPASARANYGRYLPDAAHRIDEAPPGYTALATINLLTGDGEIRWPIGRVYSRGADRYLIFRGTVSEEEWIQDVLLMQSDNPLPVKAPHNMPERGRVHVGFLRLFERLLPSIQDLHTRLVPDAKQNGRLLIAGHSLGGALASLAALELAAISDSIRPEQILFVSYGAPRVGNPAFVRLFHWLVPRAFRLANHWDPIPGLPEERVDLMFRKYEYQHAGQLLPLYALSQMDGPSLPRLIAENQNWRDWRDYVFDRLLDSDSGHRLDPLFAHQLRTYEYALRRDRDLGRV